MEQITQILNDPEQLQQITNMAASLGFGPPSAAEAAETASFPSEITTLLTQAQKREEKQQALVRALLPYLSPSRQHRLEQAIKIASLSNIAKAALQTKPQTFSKEAGYDV